MAGGRRAESYYAALSFRLSRNLAFCGERRARELGVDQRSFCGRAFSQARQLTEREEGSEDRPREEEESGM